uniref:Uncharacterized protein n=1 Tax=Arundo donax TaxID=35708 RepID=A0A0A8YYC1_ARUDO
MAKGLCSYFGDNQNKDSLAMLINSPSKLTPNSNQLT